MVCGAEAQQRLLGTLTMTGLLIGSVVGGRAGDYLGRKTCLYSATVVILLAVGISGMKGIQFEVAKKGNIIFM